MSIAPGKYLFSSRTQKSSLVAAIILLCGKLARCRIIQTSHPNGWLFVARRQKEAKNSLLVCITNRLPRPIRIIHSLSATPTGGFLSLATKRGEEFASCLYYISIFVIAKTAIYIHNNIDRHTSLRAPIKNGITKALHLILSEPLFF